MVHFAPPSKESKKKSLKGFPEQNGKARMPAKQVNSGSDPSTVRSKKELLAELTRQAEENSRILDRERAQLMALGLQAGAPTQNNRNHVFLDAKAKVFDPTQVPGLGGDASQDLRCRQRLIPDGQLGQGTANADHVAHHPTSSTPGGELSFPDTPYRKIGEIISCGGPSGGSYVDDQVRLPATYEQEHASTSGRPAMPSFSGVQLPAPRFEVSRPNHVQMEQAAKEAKQAAYRQELQDQIQAQQSRREAEGHASTSGRAGRVHTHQSLERPLRDANGHMPTNAWGAAKPTGSQHPSLPGGENHPPVRPVFGPPGKQASTSSHPGHTGQLAVHVPGGVDLDASSSAQQLRASFPPADAQLRASYQAGVASPHMSHGAALLSQTSPSAGGTTPGGRKFMAGLHALLPGPSEQQRNQKELARQQLLRDLEEQVRLKQQRVEQEKAKERAQRMREEAAFHAQQQPTGQGHQPAQQHQPAGQQAQLSQQWQQQHQPATQQAQLPQQWQQQHQQPQPAAPVPRQAFQEEQQEHVPHRRRAKGIIDAPWLDAAPPQPQLAAAPAAPEAPAPTWGRRAAPPSVPAGPTDVVRKSHPQAEPLLRASASGDIHAAPRLPFPMETVGQLSAEPSWVSSSRPVDSSSVQINPLPATRRSAGDGAVAQLLLQMQNEQSRLREEMGRQAAAMSQLRQDAVEAAAAREQALGELRTVKAMLAEGHDRDSLTDHFVVSTQLVPRTINTIPDHDLEPDGAWWRHSTDPGPYPEDAIDLLRQEASVLGKPTRQVPQQHSRAARGTASPSRRNSRSSASARPQQHVDPRRPIASPAIIRSLSPPKAARKQMLMRAKPGETGIRAADQRPGRRDNR